MLNLGGGYKNTVKIQIDEFPKLYKLSNILHEIIKCGVYQGFKGFLEITFFLKDPVGNIW